MHFSGNLRKTPRQILILGYTDSHSHSLNGSNTENYLFFSLGAFKVRGHRISARWLQLLETHIKHLSRINSLIS